MLSSLESLGENVALDSASGDGFGRQHPDKSQIGTFRIGISHLCGPCSTLERKVTDNPSENMWSSVRETGEEIGWKAG